jgi:hypothetical protein
MTTITLTMTTEQAYALTRMLDLATRIHLCQFGEIEHMARMGEIKHRDGRSLSQLELDGIEIEIKELKEEFGFPANASFGIGSPHVSKDAHRGYEVKKVVEKALAEYREPNPKGIRGVNYDGLICRYTDDPAPVACVGEAA